MFCNENQWHGRAERSLLIPKQRKTNRAPWQRDALDALESVLCVGRLESDAADELQHYGAGEIYTTEHFIFYSSVLLFLFSLSHSIVLFHPMILLRLLLIVLIPLNGFYNFLSYFWSSWFHFRMARSCVAGLFCLCFYVFCFILKSKHFVKP